MRKLFILLVNVIVTTIVTFSLISFSYPLLFRIHNLYYRIGLIYIVASFTAVLSLAILDRPRTKYFFFTAFISAVVAGTVLFGYAYELNYGPF